MKSLDTVARPGVGCTPESSAPRDASTSGERPKQRKGAAGMSTGTIATPERSGKAGAETAENTAGREPRSRTITYSSWNAMLHRCIDKKRNCFPRYGGRGITVCKRWMNFENFLYDMGPRPSMSYSLDRFPDPDGNYEPGNCRWATASEQARNRAKRGRYAGLEVNGQRKSYRDWEREAPVSRVAIRSRLASGMDPSEAVTKQPSPYRKFSDEKYAQMRKDFESGRTVASIAREMGADPSTVWRIVHPNGRTVG
jgi:hypothetical protein